MNCQKCDVCGEDVANQQHPNAVVAHGGCAKKAMDEAQVEEDRLMELYRQFQSDGGRDTFEEFCVSVLQAEEDMKAESREEWAKRRMVAFGEHKTADPDSKLTWEGFKRKWRG